MFGSDKEDGEKGNMNIGFEAVNRNNYNKNNNTNDFYGSGFAAHLQKHWFLQ